MKRIGIVLVLFTTAPADEHEEHERGDQGCGCADPATIDKETAARIYKKRPYSPHAGRNVPTRVYWGDTHQHTGYSMDAGAFGCRLDPHDAYRFARGEEVVASTGEPVHLSRPTTSSPTTRPGTRATSPSPSPRPTTCSSTSTRARVSRSACSSSRSSA